MNWTVRKICSSNKNWILFPQWTKCGVKLKIPRLRCQGRVYFRLELQGGAIPLFQAKALLHMVGQNLSFWWRLSSACFPLLLSIYFRIWGSAPGSGVSLAQSENSWRVTFFLMHKKFEWKKIVRGFTHRKPRCSRRKFVRAAGHCPRDKYPSGRCHAPRK